MRVTHGSDDADDVDGTDDAGASNLRVKRMLDTPAPLAPPAAAASPPVDDSEDEIDVCDETTGNGDVDDAGDADASTWTSKGGLTAPTPLARPVRRPPVEEDTDTDADRDDDAD